MAEPKRKDQELSTADLARSSEKPRLVRNDPAGNIESTPEERRDQRDISAERKEPASIRDPNIAGQRGAPTSPQIETSPLFSDVETNEFRSRWSNIQTGFVDEPRQAVKNADELVASLMKKLAEGFAHEREKLERQWDRGENVSTEDLRIGLQRYRSFFDRLLKV